MRHFTVSVAAQRGAPTLHHNHLGLGDRRPGLSLHNDLHFGFSRAAAAARRAHVRAAVLWASRQYLYRRENSNVKGSDFKPAAGVAGRIHTCITALVSMGTGLVSMVLRLLSSLCHETEGRGSPDA